MEAIISVRAKRLGLAFDEEATWRIDEALAAGDRLGVASSTSEANVEALLCATLGERAFDKFSAVASGDAVSAKKPAPDIYRLCFGSWG